MRAFGAEEELADAPTEADIEPVKCEVWLDNMPTLGIFLALETQWDVVAAADGEMVRTGLMYDRAEVVMRHTNGVPRRQHASILADLMAMEKAALSVMGKAREARRAVRQAELEAKMTK